MNNNIEFTVKSNRAKTKFQIKWTMNFCGEIIEKVLGTREFESKEEAQKYINDNKEELIAKMRTSISRIVINIKDENKKIEKRGENMKEEVEQMTIADMPVLETHSTEKTTVEETVVEPVLVVSTNEEEKLEDETIENEETEESELNDEKEFTEVEENEIVEEECLGLVPVMPIEKEETKSEDDEEPVLPVAETKKKRISRRAIAIILAFTLGGGLGYWIHKLDNQDKTPSEEPGIENPSDNLEEETLTTEEFENLAANFIKTLQDKNLNVTTEDIMKFVSIVNIDRLVVENPELASELFKTYTKEQYIQDAANIIGRTCMYNAKIFNDEKSTENFIRISDSLYGEQKEQMKVIESYVDQIALVYYDAEKVNSLVTELSARLLVGDLQNLDSGVQFGMQVSIEMIRSYIAKDVLTEANRDVLTEVTRLDVTEIMNMYDNINGLGTTKTLN